MKILQTKKQKVKLGVDSMYRQVISLGFFCSVAIELRRINLRSQSSPFDWVISELPSVMELIKNHFADYLNPAYLVQDPIYPYIITNVKYSVDFYHDFIPGTPIADQLQRVQARYLKRIQAFYKAITTPTLFIRYIKDQAEYDFLCDNYQAVVNQLKLFNINSELLFVGNSDLSEKAGVAFGTIYKVEKDQGDVVARSFLNKNAELMQLLGGPIVPEKVRERNRIWKQMTQERR